jgi:hypothetical protein
MKGAIDILKFFHHLRIAFEYAKSFIKDYPKSIFTPLLKAATQKIEWIYISVITSNGVAIYAPDTIPLLKQKWEGSNWDEIAVVEKLGLMNDEQIEMIEKIIDSMLLGEEITTEVK